MKANSNIDCTKVPLSHPVRNFKQCMDTATSVEANMARYGESKECILWQCKQSNDTGIGRDVTGHEGKMNNTQIECKSVMNSSVLSPVLSSRD